MSKPITPQEVVGKRISEMPEFVFDVFNELIAEAWNGYSAELQQDDVVTRIVAAAEAAGIKNARRLCFDRHWLDVEPSYRKAGWIVVYDKPGYNEPGEGMWSFRKNDSGHK